MITSAKNHRIVDARKLDQRKHRLRQDRFLVEGLQLLAMAVEAFALPGGGRRIKPRELFYSPELFAGETAPRLLEQLVEMGAEAIAVAPHILATLSERDTSQGLAATFSLSDFELSLGELDLTGAGGAQPNLVIILDQLQDPGNLGTLIRTADAIGARALVLLEPCVNPFDPKTIRGTMGSLFSMPFVRTDNLADLFTRLDRSSYRPVGADGRRGSPPWQSNILVGSVALVLGNEARGLSPELYAYLSDYVSLPLRGRAESLNVAVAGGTLGYEWLRVNETIYNE
jgi:TrmH family RNA methyltransferase